MKRNNYEKYINYRTPLKNTYDKLTKDKKINIVYFGGSITHGHGSTDADTKSWRALSAKWFKDNYPDAEINDVNAAIGESGTYFGVYRMERDVFSQSPDLVFVEFAINDFFHDCSRQSANIQYETIVREIKNNFPACDIVTLITDCRDTAKSEYLYPQALGHEEISIIYDIPTIFVGRALVESIDVENDEEWSKYFIDNAHPTDLGYKKYYMCVEEFLHNSLKCSGLEVLPPVGYKEMLNVCSKQLLDGDRKYIMCDEAIAENSKGFMYSDEVFKALSKTPYKGYVYAKDSDAEFCYEFNGTELGMYSNFCKNAKIEYSLDGNEYVTLDCAVHNPTLVVSDLEPGVHTIKIKPVFDEKSPDTMKIVAIFTRDNSLASRRYRRGNIFRPKNKEEFFAQKSFDIAGSKDDVNSYKYQLLSTGVMVRRIYVDSFKGGNEYDITLLCDTHLNNINIKDFEEKHPSVISTIEYRKGFREPKTFDNLSTIMEYVPLFDKLIINGDVIDYLTWGALEYVQSYIYDKCPDALLTVGGHDRTRVMQGKVDDPTSLESRYEILKTVWKNDLFYHSEVVDDKAMLVLLNNAEHTYFDFQIEKLRADIEKARKENLVMLIFQHEPISTYNPAEKGVKTIWKSGAGWMRNFCDGYMGNDESDDVTKEMYKVITENADVIRAIFAAHLHEDYNTEIIASYMENGEKHSAVIPQYVTAATPNQKGHMTIVTIK